MSSQIVWWMATAPRWELLVASLGAVVVLTAILNLLSIPRHKIFRLHR